MVRPIMTKTHIYQFTPRGIFEFSKKDGLRTRIFRGADLESLGGHIAVGPGILLTASNWAITAYPLATKSATAADPPNGAASATASSK
jgi:hypothetical protein